MKRGQRGFGPRSEKSFALSSAAPGSSLSYLAELPSFAGISDPNLIVSLKNVLKKDSTTKAKGLEDLVMHAQSHPFEQAGGVEESVLTIWVCHHRPSITKLWLSALPSHPFADTNLCSHLYRQLSTSARAIAPTPAGTSTFRP